MSVYPVMLDADSMSALVVGGGRVAARKIAALVAAGARVHVVALEVCDAIETLAQSSGHVAVTAEPYTAAHLAGRTLVIAATDDADVNAQVARDANERGVLVNVADAPELGNFITPAVHRAGDMVVAVTAGRVPPAAVRVRDAIASVVDDRYATAVRELAELRRALLENGARDRWHTVARDLVGTDFCEQVEAGTFASRVSQWR